MGHFLEFICESNKLTNTFKKSICRSICADSDRIFRLWISIDGPMCDGARTEIRFSFGGHKRVGKTEDKNTSVRLWTETRLQVLLFSLKPVSSVTSVNRYFNFVIIKINCKKHEI
jgi:hypothetical protein